MDDMIKVNDLVSNAELCKEKLYDVNTEIEYNTELFQLIAKKDSNHAQIKIVGRSNGKKPILKLNEFKMFDDKFECIIYQHIYIKSEISQSKTYKLISLDIKSENNIVGTISLEFNCIKNDDIMTGKYIVILHKNNSVNVLDEFERYPGNSNIIEFLIKFISHDKVLDIFI